MEKNKDKKEKKERKRMRRKGERRRRGRKIRRLLPMIYQCFDGWSSSGRELKSFYSTRAMLQEVWTLSNLAYFHQRAVWPCFLS